VGISRLRSTPVRVAAADTPIPYSAPLERAVLPAVDDLLDGIRRALV
jgi:pyruvate/2-oxoglutarate/acetoin dehydrogenase E1 component